MDDTIKHGTLQLVKDNLPFEEAYEIMKKVRKAGNTEDVGVRWAAVRGNWCEMVTGRSEMGKDMV